MTDVMGTISVDSTQEVLIFSGQQKIEEFNEKIGAYLDSGLGVDVTFKLLEEDYSDQEIDQLMSSLILNEKVIDVGMSEYIEAMISENKEKKVRAIDTVDFNSPILK